MTDVEVPDFGRLAGLVTTAELIRAGLSDAQLLRRDAELREAGFEVVHFSWREPTMTPDRVISG